MIWSAPFLIGLAFVLWVGFGNDARKEAPRDRDKRIARTRRKLGLDP